MDIEFEDLTFRVQNKYGFNQGWKVSAFQRAWHADKHTLSTRFQDKPTSQQAEAVAKKFFGDGGRVIIKSVSGKFKAGQLSAILGPSGAGKSSLLNALSGYRSDGVSGNLKVNGEPRDERKFRKMSCYITQEDLLQPMLTLKETMWFASLLKLPSATTRKQRHIVVSDILGTLGLTDCVNTGTESLSGGQRKRLSIALELINNPPILFLDEPTSGLDNVTTSYTLRLLRTLAHEGRTILCTIHQPSASLFQLFDHVYVIAAGLCVYQGATQQLVPFLSSVGLHCPRHYNPADFVIEMTDGEDGEENIERLSSAMSNGKVTHFKTSDTFRLQGQLQQQRSFSRESEDENSGGGSGVENDLLNCRRKLMMEMISDVKHGSSLCVDFPSSSWTQFCSLFRRMTLQIWRNKTGLKIQFYHHLICGLAVGIVFFNKASDGSEFFNHMKFCMGIILFHAYTQVMVPVLTFPFEVKLLKKEHFNRWYGLNPYYMALTFSKVPTLVFYSQLYLTIVYTMSGLPLELYRFIVFSTVGVITALVAEGMGLAIGSVFNVTNGSAVGPMSIAPLLGFAIYGFDFAKNIPFWLMPLLKTSFLRSGVIALIIVVFGMDRQRLDCNDEIYCHFKNPKIIIHYLDLDNVSPWYEVLTMFAMLIIFRVMCYFGLKWRLRT